ncbi:TetR family transcriptional regulator [Actinoallomurus iriomotensis]|uniref:TetR family transcriptional regulator n=1 Tax=Actinoallomurus iriomotensis TaxID=478107 RepID=A0A9W6S8P8_9ACTN|nr:TetR/AcrR family transcriptional regulator [Actinoallomurus iriomotensis]GLY87747.1 TetR family transcriptional regulator [Actinoallomurus iriomotensis]
MGNREDLLAGAKRCLYEKGYARTTIRDITAAAGGVSMAAIGYHFGSKETLLNQALAQASQEWGRQLGQALTAAPIAPDATAAERFETAWTRITDSFTEYQRLWTATFDVIGQLPHVPALREQLAAGLGEARLGLARLLGGLDPDADPDTAWAVGSFYQALLTGVMAQYLIDPDRAPSGRDLAFALQHIANAHP